MPRNTEREGKMPARLAIPSKKQVSRYHDYDPATDTEPGTPEHETFLRQRKSRILHLWSVCVLFVTLLVGLLLGFLSCSSSELQGLMQSSPRQCGSSVSEAIKQGCEFDLLSRSWSPRGCLDRMTNEEFGDWARSHARKRKAFPYFDDSHGKDWIAHEQELARRRGDIWTTEEVELGRCVFLGKRATRLKGRGREVMKEAVEQCNEMQLEDVTGIGKSRTREMGELNVKFAITYGSC